MDEEVEVTRDRRPFCTDCLGRGTTNQARAALVREPDGRSEVTTTLTPARCQACRGSGRAGA